MVSPDYLICMVSPDYCISFWITGRRCSLKYARTIGDALAVTQHRNGKARRCHRRRTIRKLHAVGIFLKDTIPCYWSRL